MQCGEVVVGGRESAPGIGAIHHVVVDEGAGLQELKGRCRAHGRLIQFWGYVGAGERAAPAPVAERRSQALASAHEPAQGIGQRYEILAGTREDA